MVTKLMRREGVQWAEVADYLCGPNDEGAFSGLLDSTVRQALVRGADFVRLRCGLPQHRQTLRAPWWIEKTIPVVDEVFAYSADAVVLDAVSALPWHMTSLASDRVDYGRDDWEDGAARHD
jgi:hypothetical protein